jgi:uncharacterized protein YbbC (DUF1343 family)
MSVCKNNKINGFTFFTFALFFFSTAWAQKPVTVKEFNSVKCGNTAFNEYIPLLKNKRVGIITNATGVIGETSIVDTLLSLKVNVKKIFGPEHGFRGNTEAGEKVGSNIDTKTGLPVISLYGANKKPSKDQLKDIDILVYDIQDVGVRFYTYISTMSYAMEACAENKKEFMVLDRPNPNGFYVDGPVIQNEYKGFLGLHAVPIVYGMTCGEYALMANNEGWLKNKLKCKLHVIPLKNYDRKSSYILPIKPSPNLPDVTAILLYPTLGLFEGSIMSLGRGTDRPFMVVGHPDYPDTNFCFTPRETAITKTPKYLNKRCCGLDFTTFEITKDHPRLIKLDILLTAYKNLQREDFFDKNFNYHAGNQILQSQIKSGKSESEIRKSWESDLNSFKKTRKKYLLYPDFG